MVTWYMIQMGLQSICQKITWQKKKKKTIWKKIKIKFLLHAIQKMAKERNAISKCLNIQKKIQENIFMTLDQKQIFIKIKIKSTNSKEK